MTDNNTPEKDEPLNPEEEEKEEGPKPRQPTFGEISIAFKEWSARRKQLG